MTRDELLFSICTINRVYDCCIADDDYDCDKCKRLTKEWFDEYDKQIRADAIDEVSRAMYHQCFECDNDEDMQKWDSGNWFRYKLFENVIEQLKEQKK